MSIGLAFDLLVENNFEQSTVFSPLSLASSLAAIHAGAEGQTQRELTDVLLKHRSPREVTKRYSDLVRETKAMNRLIDLKTLNMILIGNEFVIENEWVESAIGDFAIELQNCDFKEAEEIAKEINGLCRERTNGKITAVTTPQKVRLQKNPQAMIINAACFKGLWWRYFNVSTKRDFFGLTSKRKENYLHKTRSDIWMNFSDEDVKLVGIPYKDNNYKLWIFLPGRDYSLKLWIDAINADLLYDLMDGTHRGLCHVKFPQINASTIPVRANLERLGLHDLFTERANLERISTPSTHITCMVHKTHFEVDEEGVEQPLSPAPSTISMNSTSTASRSTYPRRDRPPAPVFFADRPFLYLVTYRNTEILLCGTYY